MSRIGKKPISLPADTKVTYTDKVISVAGKIGNLSRTIHDDGH